MTYKDWDAKRRAYWPEADHYHWESYFFQLVAKWNPNTGESKVESPRNCCKD